MYIVFDAEIIWADICGNTLPELPHKINVTRSLVTGLDVNQLDDWEREVFSKFVSEWQLKRPIPQAPSSIPFTQKVV